MISVKEKNSNGILEILKGSIISIVASIILLTIFAAVLTYTNINENTIPTVIVIVTGFSILIGSQITTSKMKKNGIINGGLVGIIYMILLYLISSCITGDFNLNKYSIIMIIVSILLGGLGGIIGVNRKSN